MAEEGQVIGCHSVESWKEQFQRGKDSKKLVMVDFSAAWCGSSRFISRVLAELAKKTPHVILLKVDVDVDELQTVAQEWEVESLPTFLFLKEGKVVDKIVGGRKEELLQIINNHATA